MRQHIEKVFTGKIIKKTDDGILIGDTVLKQITNTGTVDGSGNVFIQGITNSDVSVTISGIPVKVVCCFEM